ncbi:MAG: hypothetical protein EXR69_10880 [Myxococcales bacterium]|nr:hypothetical protein [Myxococcales bacterium]
MIPTCAMMGVALLLDAGSPAASAAPRGFQLLFMDQTGAVTGDVTVTITSPGMVSLTGTLHNDGKPPDVAANDQTWATSFSESPDADFRVQLQGTGIDLTVDVASGVLAGVPRLVLVSDGASVSASNSAATRSPSGAGTTARSGTTGGSAQVGGAQAAGQAATQAGQAAGQAQFGRMTPPGLVPGGQAGTGQFGPPPDGQAPGEFGPPPAGQAPGEFGPPPDGQSPGQIPGGQMGAPLNGMIPGQFGTPGGPGRNMAGDAGSPNAHNWYAFLPGVALWGVLIGSGLFGVGVGFGLGLRRQRKHGGALRGRFTMRVVEEWAPSATPSDGVAARPTLIVGPGSATGNILTPVLPDEVIATAAALGASPLVVVIDEALLDRLLPDEPGIDALVRVVDGQFELLVVRPTGGRS